MRTWGARSKMSRNRGEVMPMNDDDDDGDINAIVDKPTRQRPPAPRRRLLPARGWLWCFLLLNIVAVVGLIFTSAWYFPSTSTAGMVQQAIKQGDVSLEELPRRDDDDEEAHERPLGNEEIPLATAGLASTNPPTSAPPDMSTAPQEKLRLRSDDEARTRAYDAATQATVESKQPPPVDPTQPALEGNPRVTSEAPTSTSTLVEAAGGPLETLPPKDSGVEILQPDDTTAVSPVEPGRTPSGSIVRSASLEEVLRRMKGTGGNPPSVVPEEALTPTVAIVEDATIVSPVPSAHEGEKKQTDLHTESLSPIPDDGDDTDSPVPLDDEGEKKQQDSQMKPQVRFGEKGLDSDLAAWLKADDGVEVENAIECKALGTGCEVISWKSSARPQLESVVFQPIEGRMRPVFQPASHHELPMVAFSCGMTHTSGLVVHEMMTLFFVLSPSQIELGDSYRAQKFFGNAPYGQFLLHGGKPAFFTAAGLVESSFVASDGQLLLVTYRLHRHAVEIKVNGLEWSPKQIGESTMVVRVSGNAALSLGNVKSMCDTNAFQGRIAEVLVYDTALPDDRVGLVEQYLRLKWWGEKESPTPPGEEHADPTEPVDEPANSVVPQTANEGTLLRNELPDSVQPQETKELHPEKTEPPELGPRTFDPEGVFEWLPSADLLAIIAKQQGSEPSSLVDKWKQAVGEKIASVRNFQFGGEILRSFIRERRDELLTLRDEIFGG